MLLAFHHRTSLCLGICLLVIKQAFYHPGLFLPGHGIFAITLKVSQCDRAVVFFHRPKLFKNRKTSSVTARD
jgi:hypothetical protein